MIVKTLKLDADEELELNLMSIGSGRYSGTCIDRIEFLTDEEDYVIEARKYGRYGQTYLHTYTDATQIAHNLLTAYRDGLTCLSISSTATGWLQVWHRITSREVETDADAFHRRIRERKTLKHNLQYYRKQSDGIYINLSICDYKPEPGSFDELMEKRLAEEGLPSFIYLSSPVRSDNIVPHIGDIISGIVVESEGECLLDIVCDNGCHEKKCHPTTTIRPGIHNYKLMIPIACLVYENCYVRFSQPNMIQSASVNGLSIPDLRDAICRGYPVYATVRDSYVYMKGVLKGSG